MKILTGLEIVYIDYFGVWLDGIGGAKGSIVGGD